MYVVSSILKVAIWRRLVSSLSAHVATVGVVDLFYHVITVHITASYTHILRLLQCKLQRFHVLYRWYNSVSCSCSTLCYQFDVDAVSRHYVNVSL